MTDEDRAKLTAVYHAETADAAVRVRFAVEYAQEGLKALVLANGGALIALFTFIGTGHAQINMSLIWPAFAAFALGITLTLAAYVGAHLSQNSFYDVSQSNAWNALEELSGSATRYETEARHRIGTRETIVATCAAIGALACFVAGCGFALGGVLI